MRRLLSPRGPLITLPFLLAAPLLGLVPTPAAGADPVLCRGVPATVVGTPGHDRLTGTPGRDVVAALGGDDVVDARGGEDLVCGGPGDDKIAQPLALGERNGTFGGSGKDVLHLGVNLEDASGERSVAVDLRGGTTSTEGASGRLGDLEVLHLFGDPAWVFHGTSGPDKVWVRGAGVPLEAWTYGGNDMVSGSLGDDVIDGGSGDDRVRSSPGADVCRSIERGSCDESRGGSGRTSARVVRCDGERATIVGTRGRDRLRGTKGPDVIVAGGGDDRVVASGGADIVCGGPGADRLLGNKGDDRLLGGGDRLSNDPSGTYLAGDRLDGGEGDDYLDGGFDDREADFRRVPDSYLFGFADRGVSVDLTTPTGHATGRGNDLIVVAPAQRIVTTRRNDIVYGSPGDDTIEVGVGNDFVRGEDGNDTIFLEQPGTGNGADRAHGGQGDDRIYSYGGRDHLFGDAGDDLIDALAESYAATVDGGEGDDSVRQVLSPDEGFKSDGGTGRDYLVLYPSEDTDVVETLDLRTAPVTGYEMHRLDGEIEWIFHGTDGRDRVWAAGRGPLTATLYDGDDVALGSDRSDHLDGGDGADRLVGNGGEDTCVGGERGVC